MKAYLRPTLITLFFFVLAADPAMAGAYLRVISWNTLHMGWSG